MSCSVWRFWVVRRPNVNNIVRRRFVLTYLLFAGSFRRYESKQTRALPRFHREQISFDGHGPEPNDFRRRVVQVRFLSLRLDALVIPTVTVQILFGQIRAQRQFFVLRYVPVREQPLKQKPFLITLQSTFQKRIPACTRISTHKSCKKIIKILSLSATKSGIFIGSRYTSYIYFIIFILFWFYT